jgi:hypothetical protein
MDPGPDPHKYQVLIRILKVNDDPQQWNEVSAFAT